MSTVVIGLLAWLAIQPVALLLVFPLLRAASGRDPSSEALRRDPSTVVDLRRWASQHEHGGGTAIDRGG